VCNKISVIVCAAVVQVVYCFCLLCCLYPERARELTTYHVGFTERNFINDEFLLPCCVFPFSILTRHLAGYYSVVLVRKRTIPTERPPHVGEVSANFLQIESVAWSAQRIPTAVFSVF
jgi:hypothetical protein